MTIMKTLKDADVVSRIIKTIKKDDKYWAQDIADWVNNQMGGSAKGWAWESSFFDVGAELCLPLSRSGASSPMSDLTFNFPTGTIDVQAKAYTMNNSKGRVQCSTMAKTGFFEKSKKYLTENYNGKEYAEFLRTFNVPVDLILTSDSVTHLSKYYCIDFIDYFKKTTRCEWTINKKTKRKTVAKIYMLDKLGKERLAFTIGSEKSSNKNCFSRGIWMENWLLEEKNPKPLAIVTYACDTSPFLTWKKGRRL